jgi:glycosyltransferase involved in cell wall biosynthesis
LRAFAPDGTLGAAPHPLRIAIVTGFFLPVPAVRGGASEKAWHGLARIFARNGHDVTFISRTGPGLAPDETVDGVRHLRVCGFEHTRRLPVNIVLDFIWGLRVARVLPQGDVVICNCVTLPAWLHRAKPSAGKVAVMMGRAPKGQVSFYGGVARIYAPSTFVAGRITSKGAAGRTRVIGYPIDWGLHARAARQTGSPVIVGFVGRLHPEKGIALLVRAAILLAGRHDLPDWRLRIVGPAEVGEGGGGDRWLGALRQEAAPLGDRIEWLGPEFDAERLALLYGGIDIFCYPSVAQTGETFGVAVAEAMAARCAAVVSALGCFNDLVTDATTGLVFDHAGPEPAQRLAECLGRLVADGPMRMDLAMRGQQHVRGFDFAEVSRRILEDLALFAGSSPENRPQLHDA